MISEKGKLNTEIGKEVSPEIVVAIEKLTFDFQDKTSVLLVVAGLKPSAWLHFTVLEGTPGGGKIEFTEEEVEQQRNLLRKIGNLKEGRRFKDTTKWKDGRTTDEEVIEFMFGNTPDNLEKLCLAIENNDERSIGLALGYCETAVDAFVGNGNVLDMSKLPDEILFGEAANFNPGKLSADHWQEELEQYQKWADYVRKTSPMLYNKTMGIQQEQE